MVIDELIGRRGMWLSVGPDSGIVISSRVRLARNVKGHRFPGWAGEQERLELCASLRGALDFRGNITPRAGG